MTLNNKLSLAVGNCFFIACSILKESLVNYCKLIIANYCKVRRSAFQKSVLASNLLVAKFAKQ